MTAPAKPMIDELINYARSFYADNRFNVAILSTLEAHKRITESAGRPEPVAFRWKWKEASNGRWGYDENDLASDHVLSEPLYGPDLLAYADRVAAERDAWMTKAEDYLRRAVIAERRLAELQEKTQHLVEPQNPCNCVPDGDDGTVAHLCHWHKTTLGKAYRMQNMANTLTVENIAKLPMDKLRLWIAHGIQESTARKRAEERLAELQRKHDGLVARLREPDGEMWNSAWEKMRYDEFKRVRQVLSIHELRGIFTVFHAAMSAVALRQVEEGK